MSTERKAHNLLIISQIKKYLDKYNPCSKEKCISANNRTAPLSCRDFHPSKKNYYLKENEEKEIQKLKMKISELEKDFKKQKMKYKNQIILLKEKYMLKNNEIPTNNENNENKNTLILKEEIKNLKKKINYLSDENIVLLTDKKNLKNKIMNLKKDKIFLIQQINDLNLQLNKEIKPKLNENEDNLMDLKSQIMQLKAQNNKLINENNLQKSIIKDLKKEILDIHQKTSLLCKDNSILEDLNLNKKNQIKNNYISMRNLNDYKCKNKYEIYINDDNRKENINKRINTENNFKYSHPFYKNKNNDSNYYLNENGGDKQKVNINNKTDDNNISIFIDNVLNIYKKEKSKTPRYNMTSYNNKKNKPLLLKKNKKMNYIESNKENNNTNNTDYIKNNLNQNYYKKSKYYYPYYTSYGKFNMKKCENELEEKKIGNYIINNISYNKTLLSDYIEEDYNFD